ncbi:MAG: transferase, partial [Nocardioides sp.]|nr:transferase [Nocardioides sp.]
IGPAILEWGDAASDLAGLADEDLLRARPVVRSDVQQETVGRPGAEDPEAIVLRQQRGFRRARTADTVEAAFVGACDGDLTTGQLLGALAQLLERDESDLRTTYLPAVRSLVEEGFLSLR